MSRSALVRIRHSVQVDAQLAEAIVRFQRCIAERDQSGAEELLDPDYALVLVQPARAVMARDRWLEVLRDYVVHSYQVIEEIVDVDGDLAVALHRDQMMATVLGEPRNGTFIITDVWRRRDGRWTIWRRHSTPTEAGAMPGADGRS